MSDSKTNSTSNLNESNMPLLSDEEKPEKSGETPEKEAFTLEMELSEKKDSGNEKSNMEEEFLKEKPTKGPKKPSCIDILSNGLDMTDRDSKSINDEVNIAFDDVLAEPDSLHGFDCAWRLSYVTFSRVKSLTYGLLASIIAVPASIFWGLIFALLTVVHVWILTPSLKVLDLGFSVVKRIIVGFLRVTVEPLALSIGSVFSKVSVHSSKHSSSPSVMIKP